MFVFWCEQMYFLDAYLLNFCDKYFRLDDVKLKKVYEVVSSRFGDDRYLKMEDSSLFDSLFLRILLFCNMISILKRNNWLIAKIIILITIAIPLGITAFEIVILGNDSVLFLGDYPPAVGIIVLIYYGVLLVVGLIWIIMQLKSVMKLKNENRKNELLHLQSQVNPHFFFNMLNNLYGMVDKDAEKAKALILKLSDLMRYSIYEGEKNLVTIEEEIAYLKNYIELHKMRYHKSIDIQFNLNIENEHTKVMPLMFIILLENAFKHGVENLRESAFVKISLKENNDLIDFAIENNFDADEIPENKGIGLRNLIRRLELAYPKKHTLVFNNDNAVFKAQLQLLKWLNISS